MTTVDVYAEAMAAVQPESLERTYFGQVVIIDPWACKLVRGAGKVPFSEGVDNPQDRVIAIKLSIQCQGKDGGSYTVDQDEINSSKVWQITRASIEAIGMDLRRLNNAYVQVKRVGSKDFYTNKTTGERKEKQALKFVAIYPDADAMNAAADAFYTPRNQAPSVAPVAATPVAAPAPQMPSVDRSQLAQFLPVLWQQAGNNADTFHALIAANPTMAPHFNAQSVEVCLLTGNVPF